MKLTQEKKNPTPTYGDSYSNFILSSMSYFSIPMQSASYSDTKKK